MTTHAPVEQRQVAPPSSGEVAGSSPARALPCPTCQEPCADLETYVEHREDLHRVPTAQAVEEWDAAAAQRVKDAAARAKARSTEAPSPPAPARRVITKSPGGREVVLRVPTRPGVARAPAPVSPVEPGTPRKTTEPRMPKPTLPPMQVKTPPTAARRDGGTPGIAGRQTPTPDRQGVALRAGPPGAVSLRSRPAPSLLTSERELPQGEPPQGIAAARPPLPPGTSPPKGGPMVIRTCGLCHKPGHRRETCPEKAKPGPQPAAAPPRCGYCHRPAPQHSAGCKRKAARGAPKRTRPSASAAVITSPAMPGAARGDGLDLDSLRQAHALCEQRAQQYTEAAQNLKAILLLETALGAAAPAP